MFKSKPNRKIESGSCQVLRQKVTFIHIHNKFPTATMSSISGMYTIWQFIGSEEEEVIYQAENGEDDNNGSVNLPSVTFGRSSGKWHLLCELWENGCHSDGWENSYICIDVILRGICEDSHTLLTYQVTMVGLWWISNISKNDVVCSTTPKSTPSPTCYTLFN